MSSWKKFVKPLRGGDSIALEVSYLEEEILKEFEDVKLSKNHKVYQIDLYVTDSDGLTYVIQYVKVGET